MLKPSVRRTLGQILESSPRVTVVGFARDGLDAIEKAAELQPDVMTLDLVMPEVGGVGVLKALRDHPSPPRVVVVTMTDENSDLGIAALESGAFDIVRKPTALASDRLFDMSAELVAKVIAAGSRRAAPPRAAIIGRLMPGPLELVVIGASTGGPRAIAEVLRTLPATFPAPIAIVVHLPVWYTDEFARRLDQGSKLQVREATDGEPIASGSAVVARAGEHLSIANDRGVAVAHLSHEPRGSLHRPSVDELFKSAAKSFGERVVGVVLTGMGEDGADGACAIRAARGRIVVESASTCVVYGMLRAVIERGCADVELPLPEIAAALVDSTESAHRRR